MTARHRRSPGALRTRTPSPNPTLLLDVISIVVLVVDRNGAILSANAAARGLLGYQPDDLEQLPITHLLPTLGRHGSAYRHLVQLTRTGTVMELKAQTRTGRQIPMGARSFQMQATDQFVVTLRDLREKKRFEIRSRAQREYLRRVIETAGGAVITLDEERRVTLFSPRAEEMFHHPASDVIGRPFDRLLPPGAPHTPSFLSHLETPRSRTRVPETRIEITGLRRNGEAFPIEASITHFRFAGKPLVTMELRDLTEARAATRAARTHEKLFKTVFDQALQYLAILEPDGRIAEVNRAMEKLVEGGAHAVKGRHLWLAPWWYEPDGTAERVHLAVSRAMEGAVVREELVARLPDGRLRTLDFSAKPIRDDDNQVSQILAAARDITRRVKTESALRRSEHRLANAQRIAQLGHWVWNIETGDLFWSDEIYRIFGLKHSAFGATYEAFLNCVHPDDRQAVEDSVREALRSGREYKIDHRLMRPDGSVRYVHEQGEINFDESGRPCQMTGVVQDITEAKISEQNLRDAKVKAEAANQAKNAFLANMSHELRTPLNAILGFSEIMMNEMFGPLHPARYRSYPKEIHESGRHLLDIVNDILDMAKIEHGNFAVQDQTIELADIIEYCVRLTCGSAKAAGLTLTSDYQPYLPRLRADPVLLRRVILNLLSNAIKFTLPGGTVRLTAGLCHDGIAVSVADTGIGMAPEDIPKALEPFGQIEATLSRRRGGTGLGLPLSKSLIDLHGGQFQIESSAGAGTRVTVSLPKTRIVTAVEPAA